MKRKVKIDDRPFDVRILEAIEKKPMNFDQLEARFWGTWCEVTECTRNKIPRLDIEEQVSCLFKRGTLGVQNKTFFVRDPNPPAVGTVAYKPGRPRKKHPKQMDLL